jgi:hypothetical protein
MRHRFVCPPCTGQKPVSNFDCRWILHQFFFLSSRKCFKFRPYFTGFFCVPVEKIFISLWIILWKTLQVILSHKLKIELNFPKHGMPCGKLSNLARKKNFKSKKNLISSKISRVFGPNSTQKANYFRNPSKNKPSRKIK